MPVVALSDRALIRVAGPDARGFLHNLLSQDVEGLGGGGLRYGLLLTPQGRLLSAMFLLGEADGVLLDCAAAERNALVARLTMFKLRAKVTVAPVEGEVLAAWGAPPRGPGWAPDPRLAALGWRRLAAAGPHSADLADSSSTGAARRDPPDRPDPPDPHPVSDGAGPHDPDDVHSFPLACGDGARPDDVYDVHSGAAESGRVDPHDVYDVHRLSLGAPDPARDCPDPTYPIEADFDLLNAIDFRKGCFVGQETTSRMKRRGLIKTRLCPIVFDGLPPPPGAEVQDAAGRRAGEVRSGRDGRALALLRLDRSAEGGLTVEGRPVRTDPPAWLQPAFSLELSTSSAR